MVTANHNNKKKKMHSNNEYLGCNNKEGVMCWEKTAVRKYHWFVNNVNVDLLF
jgi:hypothetical protein